MKEHFDLTHVNRMLKSFIVYAKSINKINSSFKKSERKIRQPIFPSEISENIAKLAIMKSEETPVMWNIKRGDLHTGESKIEVKGFSSKAPITFGPNQRWDYISFVDCTDYKNYNFTVYLSKISNQHKKWRSLPVTTQETYYKKCAKGQSPKILFKKIQKRLQGNMITVFKGNICSLL